MLSILSTKEEILAWLREAYANRTTRPNGSGIEYVYSKDVPANFELFVQKVGTKFEDCLWAIKELAKLFPNPKQSQRVHTFLELAMQGKINFEQILLLLPYSGRKHYDALVQKALEHAENTDEISKDDLIKFLRNCQLEYA